MAALLTRATATPRVVASSAVVWITGRQAKIARISVGGQVSTCEIGRGPLGELDYLAQVVRAVGDRERVVILGPTFVRLALEREYVALYRRPDRLVDVEPAGPVTLDELVARLRTLAEG